MVHKAFKRFYTLIFNNIQQTYDLEFKIKSNLTKLFNINNENFNF